MPPQCRDLGAEATAAHSAELGRLMLLESKLVRKVANTLTRADADELDEHLQEVKKLGSALEGLGGRREDIVRHCLNGLANAKVAEAQGAAQRPEVVSHLMEVRASGSPADAMRRSADAAPAAAARDPGARNPAHQLPGPDESLPPGV